MSEGDFEQYVQNRWNAYHTRVSGTEAPIDNKELDLIHSDYEELRKNPPRLVDPEEGYQQLPTDKVELIRKKSKILAQLLAGRFSLADGEVIQSEIVTCLADSWRQFDAGTIVYLQVTNMAKVAYILPHLNLEISTGTLRALAGVYILTSEFQPHTILTRQQGERNALNALSPDTLVNAYFTFTATAAFALPAPFGILASGVLSIIPMFLGGTSDESAKAAFYESFTQLQSNLEGFFTQNTIKESASVIKDALEWLDECSQIVIDQKNTSSKSEKEYLVKEAIPNIDSISNVNSRFRIALMKLWDVSLPGDNGEWDLMVNAFDVLVTGVATYLTYLRIRIQMQAAIESNNSNYTDSSVYFHFDLFRIETNKWVSKLSNRVATLTTKRLQMVSGLQRGQDNCTAACTDAGYWYFTDSEPGEKGQRFQDTSEIKSSSSCSQMHSESVQHKDQAEAARANYIETLKQNLDERFRPANKMIHGFSAALQDWNQKMKPRKPPSSPKVSQDLSKWTGSVPQGPWVKGNRVRYCIAFANAASTEDDSDTNRSEWGNWVNVTDKAFPLVTAPIDPLNLTTVRYIHREFKIGNQVSEDIIVKTIDDNEILSFQDVDDHLN